MTKLPTPTEILERARLVVHCADCGGAYHCEDWCGDDDAPVPSSEPQS